MAATDRRKIKHAAYRVYFRIISSATLNPITGGLTAMDAEVSLDGAAFADCAGTETEIGSTTGYGFVDLTAAEMSADVILFRLTASNANAVQYFEEIRPEEAEDSGVAQAATTNTITLATTASAVDRTYNGAEIEIVAGTGQGQVSMIADYVGSTRVASVFRNWTTNPDTTSVYLIRPQTALLPPHFGKAQAGAASSITLQTTAVATNDFYNGAVIAIISGTGVGQVRTITDYSSGRVATVDRPWAISPDSTSIYIISPVIGLEISDSATLNVNVATISDDSGPANNLAALFAAWPIISSVDDTTPTSGEFNAAAGLSATDDFYNGEVVTFQTGTLAGLSRRVTNYTGATRNLAFAVPWPVAPADEDEFVIGGRID